MCWLLGGGDSRWSVTGPVSPAIPPPLEHFAAVKLRLACSQYFLSESIKRPGLLTELEVDLVVELTEPEGELLGAGDARRRLGQVRSHVLGAVRTGVESAIGGYLG